MRTAVIGSGAWGTALALALLGNGHETVLWSYTEQESTILQEKRGNPMLPGITLPDELVLTADLDCAKGCGAVVLATPSFAVRATARRLGEKLDPGTPVILVSKGIERESARLLHQVVEEEIGGCCPVGGLS